MSKTVMVFFTLMLVLASCFIAGCSSLPFSGTPAPTETPKIINAGLTGHDNFVSVQRYQLDEAKDWIYSQDSGVQWNDTPVNVIRENVTQDVFPEKHIKYIRGADIDENGDATSWTFFIEHGGHFSIVTYSTQGVTISDTPGTIQRTEIFTDQIVKPRELVEKNHDLIFDTNQKDTSVTRDLSLSGGNYTISISGNGLPRILIFDAKTGVLISSND
jgi:hypothetical protein